MNTRGYVFYRGPSLLDGEQIVGIALLYSANEKTGDMVQTYILRDNGRDPFANAQSLDDVSVCGHCKHRHGTGGACYVNLAKGVGMVWGAYQRGRYPYSLWQAMKAIAGRKVRMGSYGDPAAIPVYVWKMLLREAAGQTGYTHQWETCDPELLSLCMASVDSDEELVKAQEMGYRTFRVLRPDELLFAHEFVCPASDEELNRKKCVSCMACDGGHPPKASVAINVHGQLARRFK